MAIHKEQPMLGLDADHLYDYYARETAEDAWTNEHDFH